METVTAYIALGANLGDKTRVLLRAATLMDDVQGIEVRRVSSLFETQPIGGPDEQPNYLNGAAEIRTTLSPMDLLAALQAIEAQLGRDRTGEQRWGPRTCDLDILMMGEIVMDTDTLTIPHPRMCERTFVLVPLTEIAPDAVHPVRSKTVRALLADASGGSPGACWQGEPG